MSTVRQLPSRPNLEFEHKEAKALLRQLRAGNAEARARSQVQISSTLGEPKLADAQLVIAREYGFTSWPRLVRYFEGVERQRLSPGAMQRHPREDYEPQVRSLLAGHQARRTTTARALSAFVPRFYGMPRDEVLSITPTEDEARLAVARQGGFSSWEDLLTHTMTRAASALHESQESPFRAAAKAMEALDLAALEHVVTAHPEVLHPSDYDAAKGQSLLNFAIGWEQRHGLEPMRPIMEWLANQGLDRHQELNAQLCGRRLYMKTEAVRALLDQGADPNWVAPNGVPVLEHALLRYWNREAVDLLAQHAVPRKALWIAAGLGDVEGVKRFLDRDGHPTAAARQLRPPFDLVGPAGFLSHPEPADEEILMEAFWVAMVNGRTAVLEYMASRGAPIDSLVWGTPVINVAVGNAWAPMVECLVRCGANLDVKGTHPDVTAREAARGMLEQFPQNADRRRIAELCGMDPDAILAEHHQQPHPPTET